MAVAKVQEAHNHNDGAGTTAVTLTATAGNLLIAASAAKGGLGGTPISDGVNTWTQVTVSGGGIQYGFWYAKNTPGGALTVTFTAASTAVAASVLELSGADPTTPLHSSVMAAQPGSGTAVSVGPSAAALATDYAVGMFACFLNTTGPQLNSRTFTTALTSQTDEALSSTATLNPGWAAGFSHGQVAGANTETFAGTLNVSASSWSAGVFLIYAAGTVPTSGNSGFLGLMR